MFKKSLALVGLTLSFSANAAFLVVSEPGVATGIGALEIGGTLYNVDFESQGFAFSTFGGVQDFWGDEASAVAAVNAVTAFLTQEGTFALNNGVFDLFGDQAFGVFYPADEAAAAEVIAGAWSPYLGTGYSVFADWGGTAWSVAEVPVPAAAWLFGSALIGLAGIKRKK